MKIKEKLAHLEEENKMLKAQNYIYDLENIQLKQDISTMSQNDLVLLKSGKIIRRWALQTHLEFHKDEENEVVSVFKDVGLVSNSCVCCGEYVPEGRQVCSNCEAKVYGEN